MGMDGEVGKDNESKDKAAEEGEGMFMGANGDMGKAEAVKEHETAGEEVVNIFGIKELYHNIL